MKINSGFIEGHVASPDTGKVKDYKLTLNDISTEDPAGGEIKGHVYSPDTGRVRNYNLSLDDISVTPGEQGEDVVNGVVKGVITSPDTGNSGEYNLVLKDVAIVGGGGGGGSAQPKTVVFVDYDGTVLEEYSKDEFLAMNEMPANPTHEGLTSQGWNWSLEDAKSYVDAYGKLVVGQMYVTDDGKTRIYVHLEKGALEPLLSMGVNGTVVIDWGDGKSTDTVTGSSLASDNSVLHIYSQPGDYVISLEATDGGFALYGNLSTNSHILRRSASSSVADPHRVYQYSIRKIELGTNVSIDSRAFEECSMLTSITIPNGIISVGERGFASCRSLASIILPVSLEGTGTYAFQDCFGLSCVSIPNSMIRLEAYMFCRCRSLTSIIVPDSVMSIGDNVFQDCYSLADVVISNRTTVFGLNVFTNCYSLNSINIPSGTTSIAGYEFSACYNLTSVNIPNGVTSIGNNAFSSCVNLKSVNIPDSVTDIGNYGFSGCSFSSITLPKNITSIKNSAFNGNAHLASIDIPVGVTSIGQYAFANCKALANVTLPVSILTIQASAFLNCSGVGEYHFKATTPPNLANKSAFSGIAAECVMFVPYSEDHSILNAYKNATNWSEFASRMVEDPEE